MAEWFGLNDREANWVRSAKAGNEEDGYSEALLGVDEEGWFPLRVRASEYEVEVLESAQGSEDQPVDPETASEPSARSADPDSRVDA